MRKTARTMFFSTLVMAVLSAGTLSARQLYRNAQAITCGGSCGASHPCKTGCICAFPLESTTGFCSTHPTGVQPPAR